MQAGPGYPGCAEQQEVTMPTGLRSMPCLAATDPAATAGRLERLFGFRTAGFWRDDQGVETFGILRLGLVTLALRRAATVTPQDGWAAYLHVDDATALAELARAQGGVLDGPEDRPWGCREVLWTDPDGNVICFAEDLRPGPDGPGL
jgi:predicted enzyme related to lactoylglutathione lyase